MSASQSSNIAGNYNITVQAHGDGITIDLSQPHLSLVAWHRQPSKPEKILDLLNPFVRAIPLVGRESAKADLEKWLASSPPISVRCLIGGAGSGKTRLGIELCESAEQRKWFAGFATHRELARFASQQNLSSWGWSKNTLVVVDYAAARARVLREWMVELARNFPNTGNCLRLLVLERHAEEMREAGASYQDAFKLVKRQLAKEKGVVSASGRDTDGTKISRDKVNKLSHVVVDLLASMKKECELLKPKNDVRLEALRILHEHLRAEEKLEERVRQKITSQKREIVEGSQEWDLLFRRYYGEEMKKLGVG